MSATINRNAVGIRGEETLTDLLQTAAAFIEDGDNAAFGRHIETSEVFIKCQHIGVSADSVNTCH